MVFSGHVADGGCPTGTGAIGASGTPEYEHNDRVARALVARLEASGRSAVLVSAEAGVCLRDRPVHAARLGAALVLEIHHDSAQPRDLARLVGADAEAWEELSGFSVFFSSASPVGGESRVAGQHLGSALAAAGFAPNAYHARDISGERRHMVLPGAGLYDTPFQVLRLATVPTVLVECGVITNPWEEHRLLDPVVGERILGALAAGVEAHLVAGSPPASANDALDGLRDTMSRPALRSESPHPSH